VNELRIWYYLRNTDFKDSKKLHLIETISFL